MVSDKFKAKQQKMSELAKECITRLHGMGYSIRDIEKELDGRVTWRTLYRWHKQETPPKREGDVLALKACYLRISGTKEVPQPGTV
jgi:transposase-like protein